MVSLGVTGAPVLRVVEVGQVDLQEAVVLAGHCGLMVLR